MTEIDVDSDSGMLQTFLDAQVPLGYSVYEFELGLHPYIVRTDIYGSARAATGPDYFHELGADLTFNQNSARLIDGFYVGGSYITGEDFSGYRLGLGLMF